MAWAMTVLPLPGRPVDEHRVRRADGRAHLIEHALAEDEMRERFAHAARA